MNQVSIEQLKKSDMQNLIDKEHGKNYHRNIDLSGYTVYRGDSFITFRFVTIGSNNRTVVYVDYIYVTDKKNLIKLMAWCINFWTGNGAQCIYYRSHKRKANYVEKSFPSLDFHVTEKNKQKEWKYKWTSTNGYSENNIIEAFV